MYRTTTQGASIFLFSGNVFPCPTSEHASAERQRLLRRSNAPYQVAPSPSQQKNARKILEDSFAQTARPCQAHLAIPRDLRTRPCHTRTRLEGSGNGEDNNDRSPRGAVMGKEREGPQKKATHAGTTTTVVGAHVVLSGFVCCMNGCLWLYLCCSSFLTTDWPSLPCPCPCPNPPLIEKRKDCLFICARGAADDSRRIPRAQQRVATDS